MKINLKPGDMIKLDLSSYAPKVVDIITPALTEDGWLNITHVDENNIGGAICKFENQRDDVYLETLNEYITEFQKSEK